MQPIVPPDSPPPLAPYSPGVRVGNTVYVSGMLALDAQGQVHGKADVRAQTRKVIESIRAVLEAAGGGLRDVAHNAIFLKDLGDYAAMNEIYAEYFPHPHPARYCIRADLVRADFLVEISAVAHLDTRS